MNQKELLICLKKIEGQARGIQKMIEEDRGCLEIINQIHSVKAAVAGIEKKFFEGYLKKCVKGLFNCRSQAERQKGIEEVVGVLKRLC